MLAIVVFVRAYCHPLSDVSMSSRTMKSQEANFPCSYGHENVHKNEINQTSIYDY